MNTPQRFPIAAANLKADAASNSNAVVTLAAPGADKRIAFQGLFWSYSGGDPTGGRLVVTVDGTAVFDVDITAKGPGFFPTPLYQATENKAVVLTLYAGGSGVTGKVGFFSAWTESVRTI